MLYVYMTEKTDYGSALGISLRSGLLFLLLILLLILIVNLSLSSPFSLPYYYIVHYTICINKTSRETVVLPTVRNASFPYPFVEYQSPKNTQSTTRPKT